ncbi:MAG TPA: glycosyltransferase [Planctomycetota bacterium]|nr:glycosyltransferase [Planctomycetota bacterium]
MVVAVVLETWPKASERFISRELAALAGLGLDLRIFAVARGPEGLLAEEPFAGLAGRVSWLPGALSARGLAGGAGAAAASPGRMLRLLPAAVSGELRDPVRLARLLPRMALAPALAREVRRAGAELLWAHFASLPGAVGWMASRLAGVPFALSVHAWDVFVNRALVAAQLEEARLVTACSRAAMEFLQRTYGPSAAKVELCYHGVPLPEGNDRHPALGLRLAEKQPPAVPKAESPKPQARPGCPFRVLAIGRLVPKKGFAYLIEAAALARGGFEVELAGDGPERGALEALAAARGLTERVTFSGEVGAVELSAACARADAVCAPSVVAPDGDRDGVPNSLLEAMACGLPAVAADAGGLGEAVEDGRSGLLVPPADPPALAAAIGRIAGDPPLAARLASGAGELLRERFSLERNVRRLAGLLAAAAGRDA